MSRESLGTKHPHSLMVPQAVTEQLLVELCKEKGVKFFFGHLAITLVQDSETVTVETETGDGTRSKFTVSWFVGCDGTKSAIRKLANFEFPGTDGNISGWLVDVLATDHPSHPLSVNNEYGSFLMQPLGSEKYYRLTRVNINTMCRQVQFQH